MLSKNPAQLKHPAEMAWQQEVPSTRRENSRVEHTDFTAEGKQPGEERNLWLEGGASILVEPLAGLPNHEVEPGKLVREGR